jgi:hypothetical protein
MTTSPTRSAEPRGPSRRRLVSLAALAALVCVFLAPASTQAAPTLNWSSTTDTGASTADRTRAISLLTNGDVIAAYQIGAGSSANIRVKRLAAANGNALWTRDISTAASAADDVADLVTDPATGDTWIATRYDNGANLLDWFVTKLNGSDGTVANSYTFGTTGNDEPRAICRSADGNIVVVGMETNTTSGLSRARIVKLNSGAMTSIWSDTSSTDRTDLFDVVTDSSNNVFACGVSGSAALVTKYLSGGTSSWSQTPSGSGTGNNQWNAITLLSTGDVAVAGTLNVTSQGNNLAAARYPAAGGVATWSRDVNGSANADEVAYDITTDASNNLYVAGFLNNTTGLTAYGAKLDAASGTVTWTQTVNGTSASLLATDAFFSVQLVGTDVFFGGTQSGTTSNADIVITRVSTAGTLQESTVFNGTANNFDTSLSKNLLTSNSSGFAIGGDTENATPSTDGLVRSYAVAAGPDTTPPTISGTPTNITNVQATGPLGAVVTFASPTALDNVDGPRPVTCTPASGSTFPIGTTTVTCTASDLSGNPSSTTFTITVVDTLPPLISNTPSNIPGVEATSPAGAVVFYTNPTATDIVDGSRTVTCTPASGSVFPLGTTTVTCSATDLRGNSASTSFTVTIQDTTPPVISNIPSDITGVVATSPAGAVVTFASPTANDIVSGSVSVFCVLPSGSTFAIGLSTVVCTASDSQGNFASGSFTINVLPMPTIAPIASSGGDVITNGGAPDATGADSGADFDVLKRGGFLAQNGTLVFPGNLLVGSGAPPVTLSDFQGLWKDNGTGLKLIARTGTIAPGTTTDTFNGLPNVPGISDNGDVTILGALTVAGATTASNDTGLWTQVGSGTTPSTFKLLAREGSVIPGTSAVVRKFASGAYATASFSATQGAVAYSVTTVGAPDKTAIYSTTVNSGTPTSSVALAIEGDAAPGVAGQTFGPLASSYSDPARMDTAGNVAFAAILKPSNKESLWYAPYSTGVATKIFAAGDVAPDTGGATFLNLKSQALGGTGTITFRGFLTSNTGDNTGNLKNDGIWRGTGSNVGTYTCILRRGDSNATRPGLNLPNAADKVGNLWHSWLTNANHGAWVGQLDAGGDGTSVPAPGDTYGIYTDLSGTMTLYMLYGDPAPGIPGAVMDTVDLPIVGGQEQMVFIGKVTGGGVTAGVNDQGIWRCAPNGGALSLLIRTGDSMTTTAGSKTIAKVDFPGSGSKARQWEQPVMDSTGRVLIFVTFIDGSTSQVIAQ